MVSSLSLAGYRYIDWLSGLSLKPFPVNNRLNIFRRLAYTLKPSKPTLATSRYLTPSSAYLKMQAGVAVARCASALRTASEDRKDHDNA